MSGGKGPGAGGHGFGGDASGLVKSIGLLA
jgi:hypothetical protein